MPRQISKWMREVEGKLAEGAVGVFSWQRSGESGYENTVGAGGERICAAERNYSIKAALAGPR